VRVGGGEKEAVVGCWVVARRAFFDGKKGGSVFQVEILSYGSEDADS